MPAILFAFAAWTSYRETLRQGQARVERTVRILEEHALKVFETNGLVIQQVNERIRFMDWTREADRADLHALLAHLQTELDQVSTITVTDAQGAMRASGRMYPAQPSMNFADRDYFQALRKADQPLPFVSSAYHGRQTNQPIFNLAGRAYTPPGVAFDGVVAVSADRAYFETFYKSVDASPTHAVILVRGDGVILASDPPLTLTRLPDDSALRHQILQSASGAYRMLSHLDGIERLFAYHQIGHYPVFVRFGLSTETALEPWRVALFNYGIVASLASLALVVASTLAVRQTRREQLARRRWEEMAAALRAEAVEREHVEGQLRQAQKMEAVGRLTGGIAHDFNNLLTAVIGSLDLLRRRGGTLDERGERLVGNALDGAQRAAALTSRLLAFSRRQPLQPVLLDTNRLVEDMSELLRRTLGETVAIETHLAGDLWMTLADPNQLESALLNLAVNARDAMPDGGRLTIETENAALDQTEDTELSAGDYVMVTVADTGSGMSPDVISRIFEPFFTTKPVGKGTGLGLSQVYGFVKQSGGHVAIASVVGQGSTFRLYLPRSLGDPSAPSVVSPSAAPSREADGDRIDHRGATILVVEDEERVRDITVAALEEAGFTVHAAADAAEGLSLFRRHREIGLIFTDIVLAGSMNGRAFAEIAVRERPALPVLFTSGYSGEEIIHDGRVDAGLNFIAKPFTSGDLVAKVGGLLKNHVEHATPLL